MGFSTHAVGIMYFILQWSTVLGRILASVLADKLQKQKVFLVAAVFLCSCSLLLLSFLSLRRDQVTVLCQSDASTAELCDEDQFQNVALEPSTQQAEMDVCQVGTGRGSTRESFQTRKDQDSWSFYTIVPAS